jgi:hypothetical protein
MKKSLKYVNTLIKFTEYTPIPYLYSAFCNLGHQHSFELQLPCNVQNPIDNQIPCINCIYNKEDTAPKLTREFLSNIIQTSKES